ncbi:odorant receptor 67d-like [Scaptodrosophila lebanonensis]|uniref:Odorant receptor n=1 Tax=Drosophila lebanonensis TaxID=7225 RepID=A0A6J2TAP8_DROLE|nr:odorant receptor 67d-like [Scaptodrosophila lebanonensis]
MAESVADRFNKIVSVVRFCLRVCGADVCDLNYRMYWLTYCVLAAIFFFYACTAYTLYVGVIQEGDWTIMLEASCMVGSAIQGLTKLYFGVTKGHLMQQMEAIYKDIYKTYERLGGEYREQLIKRIKITKALMNVFMWIYIILVVALVSLPLFYLVVFKEKMLVMQFLVPGIDRNSDVGHLMLLSLHTMCLSFGAFGNFGADMFLFLFVSNLPLLTDLVKVKLKDFNELVVQHTRYKETRALLWNIFSWHQKYVRLLSSMEELYNGIMFVQLSTSCTGILCTISCIFIGVWPAAPVYLLYSASVLYTFCALGNLVELSNEEFAEAVYCDCMWYELPVKDQKLIIIMLSKSQNEILLSAGDVMPLSMATALQLSKGIYSFSMFLFTYLE